MSRSGRTRGYNPLRVTESACLAVPSWKGTTLLRLLPRVLGVGCLLAWRALLPPEVRAGVDRWTPIAPDGGAVTALAVDPQNHEVLYAATEAAGVFRSSDGAASWLPARTGLPAGQPVRQLAAGGSGGRTLAAIVETPFFIDQSQPVHFFVSSDGGGRWVERPLPTVTGPSTRLSALAALAVSPGSAPTLYLAASADGGGRLFESADLGLTWASVPAIPPGANPPGFVDLVIAPSAPNVLYALTGVGDVLTSGDGGVEWSVAGHLLPETVKLAVDPRDQNVLCAATVGALTCSGDGGHTWSRLRVVTTQVTAPGDRVVGLAFDPAHRGTLFYAAAHLVAIYGSLQSDYIEERYDGLLFRSLDGGRSWELKPVTQVVAALAVVESATASGTRLYAGASRDGVLRSDDGGSSWQPAATGLKASANCSIAADPFVPRLLYLSAGFCIDEDSDIGFLRGGPGQGWTPVNRGLREPTRVLDAFGIVPDPRSPGTLYALTGQGLFKSEDRGDRWRPLRRLASDQEAVTSLAIDPLDAHRLYAVGFAIPDCGESQCGLAYFARKSLDAGETWTDLLPRETYLQSIAVDPLHPETLYVTGFFPGGAFPPPVNLLKSIDRGRTWKPLTIFSGSSPVLQLLIHPRDSRLLFASLFSYNEAPKIVKSRDGGESWTVADSGLPRSSNVEGMALDPSRPATLYAATDQGLFVSDDGEGHWSPLSAGLGSLPVWQVLVDPFDPLTLYAGTPGNGGLFVLTRAQAP
jgi:photosystem II stability/assembly factor-like uncharacterized protein